MKKPVKVIGKTKIIRITWSHRDRRSKRQILRDEIRIEVRRHLEMAFRGIQVASLLLKNSRDTLYSKNIRTLHKLVLTQLDIIRSGIIHETIRL